MKFLKHFFKRPGSDLERELGYVFKDRALLVKALTHRSTTTKNTDSYERLEFLGDSVLQLIVSEYLFQKFPDNTEGKLSLFRSAIVSKKNLSGISRKLGLVSSLKISESVNMDNSSTFTNISSSMLESIIGAIYIDGGLKAARRFILNHIIGKTNLHQVVNSFNYKGRLIEFCRQHGLNNPRFRTSSQGPDHNKTFSCTIVLDRKLIGTGEGKSKKSAEENASRNALEKLLNSTKK